MSEKEPLKEAETAVAEEKEEAAASVPSTLSGPPKEVSTKKYTQKRPWRLILIVALVALVLGGGVYAAVNTDLLSTPETSDTSAENTETVAPIIDKSEEGTEAVVSVRIQHEDADYTVKKNADGLMTVSDYADLPRDADAVESLLSSLLTVTPSAVVMETASKDDLTACGLTEPDVTATVTYADGETLTLCIGHLDAGSNEAYYGCESDDNTVYLISSTLYQTLTQPATAYLATVLTAAPEPASDDDEGTAKLDAIELSGTLRSRTVKLRHATDEDNASLKLAGNYVVVAPYTRAINTDTVSPWETGLADATASGVAAVHPTNKELKAFGLDTPRSVAKITFGIYPSSEDETSEADIAYETVYNRVTYTVSLGNKTEDGGYYAMVNGVDIVYTVTADTVPWAELTYDDVVASTLFLHYITEVSEIGLTVDGTTSTVKLTHTTADEASDGTATFTAKAGNKELSEENTRALYRLMMMTKRLASDETLSAPSGTPVLTLRLSFLDKGQADAVIRFYDHSANRYLCVAEDGDTYLVKASDVESLLTQISHYLAGESVTE